MKYVKQDLLAVDRGVIAHGCNYVGVMGAGVAKMVRDKYPQAFKAYAMWLADFGSDRKNALGQMHYIPINENLWIANCITQGLASYDGQLATPRAIQDSLGAAFGLAVQTELPLYMPKIGAGLGGLNWEQDVEPIIANLSNMFPEVHTYICVWP